MTKEEIIEMVNQTDLLGIIDSQYYENKLWIPDVIEFAKLVAQHERDACSIRASVALLGTLKDTADRVLRAIRRGDL